VLVQEHPIKFVERVARLMRIPPHRHRRHLPAVAAPGPAAPPSSKTIRSA
jgi:hypothetical protein